MHYIQICTYLYVTFKKVWKETVWCEKEWISACQLNPYCKKKGFSGIEKINKI